MTGRGWIRRWVCLAVQRLAVLGLILAPAAGCALFQKDPQDPLERNALAFQKAREAKILAENGWDQVQGGAEEFLDSASIQQALGLYEEAHRLQPRSPKISMDLATLHRLYGEAWDARGGELLAAAEEAEQAGSAAEAQRRRTRADAAGQQARDHFVACLPLYENVVQESTTMPRDVYAEALYRSSVILILLNRGVADLERARNLLQSAMDVGRLTPEWQERFQGFLVQLDREIARLRLGSEG